MKSTNKRPSFRVAALAGVVAMLGMAFAGLLAYITIERRFDPLPTHTYRVPESHETNQILVGIVGDSWVAGQKLDSTLADTLSRHGIHWRILSSGHPGANSRQVYRNLTLGDTQGQSILKDPGLRYLVILAGVNDTAGHYGRTFIVII